MAPHRFPAKRFGKAAAGLLLIILAFALAACSPRRPASPTATVTPRPSETPAAALPLVTATGVTAGFEAGVGPAYSADAEEAQPTAPPAAAQGKKATPTRSVTARPTRSPAPTIKPTRTPAPAGRPTSAAVPDSGLPKIRFDRLPSEAQDTIRLIQRGGPFPYRQDGIVFQNRERLLPRKASGYYHEYTVETPGSSDRGARRIIAGGQGELYYTDDHYASFKQVVMP